MTTTGFDLAAYKTAQQRDWTTAAQGRQQFHAVSERQWWQVSHGLLERARVTPGQRLWDVTTGIGQPALTAATLVGASGRVLGTDLSRR
jgi:ubiquinone/menaquinone biosynthesis C-methylase UbiE